MPAVLAGERARLSPVAARAAGPAPAPEPAAPSPIPVPADAVAPAPKLAAALERDPLLDDFGDEDATVLAAMFGDSAAPLSYRGAMQSSDSDLWSAAVRAEIDSLVSNGTFQAVPEQSIPADKKLLSTRWVFTRKSEADGSTRHKARLVARGDHQRAGVDFNDVYSPVVNGTTLRTLLAVAAVNDWHVDQMDAVTAFLNAPMGDEELYVRVPEGFIRQPGTVLRLKKAIYGLKQAPRYWNQLLHNWLLAYGLQQSQHDPCLYFIPGKLYVCFWVDDFLILARDASDKDSFKAAISAAFKMKDLGAVARFLGMEVQRNRAGQAISLTSSQHIDDMLQRFGMQDCKPTATPLPHKAVLGPRGPDEQPLPPQTPYRSLVGSLLYVAMWTRPDIAFAVSQVARFQSDPSVYHWDLAKNILRYLKGTRARGLTFSPGAHGDAGVVRGYVDASWGEDPSTRKSQSGYVFTLGNAAISWKSKLQTTVALSSTEAEYLALSAAVKEALFLRNLVGDVLPSAAKTIVLHEDNQSTIKQALNLTGSERTKHVDIRHHFLKAHVANGDVRLEYLPTAQQPADALTKPVDKVKVSLFSQIMLGTTA